MLNIPVNTMTPLAQREAENTHAKFDDLFHRMVENMSELREDREVLWCKSCGAPTTFMRKGKYPYTCPVCGRHNTEHVRVSSIAKNVYSAFKEGPAADSRITDVGWILSKVRELPEHARNLLLMEMRAESNIIQ